MAASVRSSTMASADNTAITVTKPTGTAAGDYLYAWISSDDNAPSSAPTGWVSVFNGGANSRYVRIWKKLATSSEAANYSFAISGFASVSAVMLCVTGIDATTQEDVAVATGAVTAAATTAAAPSVTTATAGDLILTSYTARQATGTAVSATPPSGMTEYQDTAYPYCALSVHGVLQAAAGATGTKTVTGSASSTWTTTTMALRSASTVVTPDTTAPSAPTLTATPVSATQVNLSWTAATDNVGVTGYDVVRGNTVIASDVAGTTYSDTTVSASSTFNYTVRAKDAAGNVTASNTAPATTPAASSTTTLATSFLAATGAAWPGWTGSGGGSGTIQSNLGRVVTAAVAYGSNRIQVWTDAPSVTDCELYGSVAIASTAEQYLNVAINGDSTGQVRGYTINLEPAGAIWELGKLSGVGNGPVAVATAVPFTFTAGQRIAYRLKRTGALVQARVWVYGTTEPSTWGASYTDPSPLAAGQPIINYIVGGVGTAQTSTFYESTLTTAGTGTAPAVPAMPRQVSGALVYTTAAGTPVYKYEVNTATTATDSSLSTGQKQSFVYVPGSLANDKTKTAKFVLAAHGLGDDPSGFMEQASITDPLLRLLMDAGYVVIVPQYDQTIGNQDGQTRALRAYTYLLSVGWAFGGVVHFGFSMGGALAAIALMKGTVAAAKTAVLVSPVINFADAYSGNPTVFNAAYGSTNATNFATATADWDPARQPASAFAGGRIRINSASDDGYTWIRPDSVSFLNNIRGTAAQAVDVQVSGGHGTAGQFVNPDQMVSFFEAAVASPAAYTGTFGLTGAGTLTLVGKPAVAGTLALTATSALALSGSTAVASFGTLALTGSGSPSLSGTPKLTVSAALGLTGSGALVLSGVPKLTGTLALSATASTSYFGTQDSSAKGGAIGLSTTGVLVLSGSPQARGSLAPTGVAALVLTGTPQARGALALTGAGSLSLVQRITKVGSLDLTVSGLLTLDGRIAVPTWRALQIIVVGTGSGFVRAFNPGDDVPASVVAALSAQDLVYLTTT